MAMKKEKIINDPVFGTIKLPRVCVKIMDTPEFQRLRFIQQLGCTPFVYPSGTHSRFNHSIGVMHIAMKMVEMLREKQSHLDEHAQITDVDVLCIAVAAMCHDLGHGPYSHTWEHFMKRARPEQPWKHEETSVLMFQRIWNKLSSSERFPLEGIDKIFIEELIYGVEDPNGPWRCRGRPRAKSFLYEIVANKVNGVDVDRFAYISQDCQYLGINPTIDFSRFLEMAQVVPVNGRNTICFKSSTELNMYDFFHARWKLHRHAYRHRVALLIEDMFIDALLLANDSLLTPGKDGVKLHLCETADDLDAFVKTVDSVYHRILLELPDDHPAHVLIDRIQTRNLYVQVDKILMPKGLHVSASEVKEEILKISNNKLDAQDFTVHVEHYDFGMKGQNPVNFVNFYDEIESVPVHVSERKEVSHLLPETYEEEEVRVVCKKRDSKLCSAIKVAFRSWVCSKITHVKVNGELL